MSARPTADIVSDLRLRSIQAFPINVAIRQYMADAAERLTELDGLIRDIVAWDDWQFNEADSDNGERLARAKKAAIATWKATL